MDELNNLKSFSWQGTNDSPGVRPHVLPIDGFEPSSGAGVTCVECSVIKYPISFRGRPLADHGLKFKQRKT